MHPRRQRSVTAPSLASGAAADHADDAPLDRPARAINKGHVRHEVVGKAFRYYPRLESRRAGSSALARVLDTVYRGSRELLVAGLLEDKDIHPEELERIRRLIDQRLRDSKQ